MPDPSTLRDSTQIVLSSEALAEFRVELDERFTLTFFEVNERTGGERAEEDVAENDGTEEDEDVGEFVRVIGSPVEIKAASEFLSRHGVTLR